jgi:hypothetical protein
MKYLAILLSAFIFIACGAPPAANTNTPSTATAQTPIAVATNSVPTNPVDFLLTSAATDFHEHGPKGPLQFRNVRVGHVPGSDGKDQYLLCGEFVRTQEGEKNGWTKFATIKTSGYEQYIGENIYCQRPTIVWDAEGDLSSSLQKQFDSLPSTRKN